MKTQTHVGIIGSVGVPARYGGFETLAHQLVLHLQEQISFTIYCSAKAYPPAERKKSWQGARLVYVPLEANGWQSVLYDGWSLFLAMWQVEVLMVLGVSGCLFLPLIRLFTSKPIIVHIDGLEWRRQKWGKVARWYLKLGEQFAAKYADLLVADNQGIQDHIQQEYGKPSALIAYGGDQASSVDINHSAKNHFSFLTGKYGFTVCRIEPENHIDLLLEAFCQFEDYPLVVVGNWNHSAYGQDLKKRYDQHANLHLLDPIYEPGLLNMLRGNAYIYLHGHEAGGTNPSLVEAMNLSLPILAYDVVYNRMTTENSARYFQSATDLRDLLGQLSLQDREQLAEEMSEIAHRRYRWPLITQSYLLMWQEVLYGLSPDSEIRPISEVSPVPQN